MSKAKSWADDVAETPASPAKGPSSTPQAGGRLETPQADGSILITAIVMEDGKKVSRTTRVRRDVVTDRFYPSVKERSEQWVPFGRAKREPDAAVTDIGDPVPLVLSATGSASSTAVLAAEKMTQKALMDLQKDLQKEMQRAAVRDKMEEVQQASAAAAKLESEASSQAPSGPQKFQARSSGEGNSMSGPKQEVCALRISNLSEETNEEALRMLCAKVGRVQKVYIPWETVTLSGGRQEKRGKGFAFVTFSTKREAEEAIKKLDRLAFRNTILSVDWGKH